MSKTETMTVKTEASLKDVIWATLQTATEQLKAKVNKSGLIEFKLNGCEIECVVRSPKGTV